MTDIVEEILKDHGSKVLTHYGVLGMHWGHRKSTVTSTPIPTSHKNSKPGIEPFTTTYLAIGAAYTAYHFVDSGKIHQFRTRNTPFQTNTALSKKNMSVNTLHKTVVKPINPEFGKYGTKMNCRRCTFAYEMRRRGMDVKATKTSMASGQSTKGLIKAITPKGSPVSPKHSSLLRTHEWGENKIGDHSFGSKSAPVKSEAIFKAIESQPHGARGELAVGWKFGGGHSLAWENVKGKAVIFDTQSGKTYQSSHTMANHFGSIINEAAITRLDNASLNEQFLRRWVENVD